MPKPSKEEEQRVEEPRVKDHCARAVARAGKAARGRAMQDQQRIGVVRLVRIPASTGRQQARVTRVGSA